MSTSFEITLDSNNGINFESVWKWTKRFEKIIQETWCTMCIKEEVFHKKKSYLRLGNSQWKCHYQRLSLHIYASQSLCISSIQKWSYELMVIIGTYFAFHYFNINLDMTDELHEFCQFTILHESRRAIYTVCHSLFTFIRLTGNIGRYF